MKTPICQSCGVPLTNKKLISTEKDGSPNSEYCIYCYKNGSYTDPDISMEEMADACSHYLAKSKIGFDKKTAHELMEKLLPTLKRWR